MLYVKLRKVVKLCIWNILKYVNETPQRSKKKKGQKK